MVNTCLQLIKISGIIKYKKNMVNTCLQLIKISGIIKFQEKYGKYMFTINKDKWHN